MCTASVYCRGFAKVITSWEGRIRPEWKRFFCDEEGHVGVNVSFEKDYLFWFRFPAHSSGFFAWNFTILAITGVAEMRRGIGNRKLKMRDGIFISRFYWCFCSSRRGFVFPSIFFSSFLPSPLQNKGKRKTWPEYACLRAHAASYLGRINSL